LVQDPFDIAGIVRPSCLSALDNGKAAVLHVQITPL
jgi:hypothetical protein